MIRTSGWYVSVADLSKLMLRLNRFTWTRSGWNDGNWRSLAEETVPKKTNRNSVSRNVKIELNLLFISKKLNLPNLVWWSRRVSDYFKCFVTSIRHFQKTNDSNTIETASRTAAESIHGLSLVEDESLSQSLNPAKHSANLRKGCRPESTSRSRSVFPRFVSHARESHGIEGSEKLKGALWLLLANTIETGCTHFEYGEQYDTQKNRGRSMHQT